MSVPTPPLLRASRDLSSTRVDLESADGRRRLAAIGELSRLVDASKVNQQAVGAFLRDRVSSGKRLLDVVLADLQATDRTLRCAAARLVCQLAYENLVNQESIVQSTKNVVSVGWLHVFSVPPAYHEPNEAPCNSRPQQSQRGLTAFLQGMVADAYSEVYDHVGRYYANGCQSFLPICWYFPRSTGADDDISSEAVPDPADHVLGFYLVPRETQFPEHDGFYHDDLLQSLDKHDLDRLEAVKLAFEKVTDPRTRGVWATKLLSVIVGSAADEEKPLRWLVDAPTAVVATLCDYFSESAPDTLLTWTNILVYASVRLNSDKLAATYDDATLIAVAKMFHGLAFTSGDRISSRTNVWLPVLVAAIQRDTELPAPFKKLIQSLQRGVPCLARHDQPWRVLLGVKLDQVVPVSWAVFLAQWRIAMELDTQLTLQQAASAPVRRTSVCSVGDLRRSVGSPLQSQSVRDLSHRPRDYPTTARFASQQDLTGVSRPLPAFHERTARATDDDDDDDAADDDKDSDTVAHNMALFHRIQRSLADLDELGMTNLQERRKEKQRTLETVATNKQRAQDDATRKRLHVDDRHRAMEAVRAELERRKAQATATAHERQQSKQALAAHRKQQRDAALDEKQRELAQKIAERDRWQEQSLCRRRRQQADAQQAQRPRPCTGSSHDDPPNSIRPRPPLAVNQRLSSARGARSAASQNAVERPSPEILRQRALLYGQVVSKIYVAEALHRRPEETEERTIHQPHQLTRSFSVFQNGSFNVKAPIVKVTPPPSRRPRSPRHRGPQRPRIDVDVPEGERNVKHDEPDHEEGGDALESRSRRSRPVKTASSPEKLRKDVASSEYTADPSQATNACATLVMRNAALAVSERIRIPEIPAPHVEEPSVPPYVIAAQYAALDDQYKRNFRERFNLKCVSHRLSYDVLKQYTKIVRRDMAWRAFHDKCSGSIERVKYMDFAGIAQSLGVLLSEKKLLVVARQLDPKKSGYVEWKAFYTWWIMQYSDPATGSPPARPQTTR